MSADLVMVQESVKLALDAADAAADVTAEYNKVKKENKDFLKASAKNFRAAERIELSDAGNLKRKSRKNLRSRYHLLTPAPETITSDMGNEPTRSIRKTSDQPKHRGRQPIVRPLNASCSSIHR